MALDAGADAAATFAACARVLGRSVVPGVERTLAQPRWPLPAYLQLIGCLDSAPAVRVRGTGLTLIARARAPYDLTRREEDVLLMEQAALLAEAADELVGVAQHGEEPRAVSTRRWPTAKRFAGKGVGHI